MSPYASAASATESLDGQPSGEEQVIIESVESSANKQKKTNDNQLPDYESEFVAVPFAFSTESLSTAFGAAGVLKHAGQIQSSILGLSLIHI